MNKILKLGLAALFLLPLLLTGCSEQSPVAPADQSASILTDAPSLDLFAGGEKAGDSSMVNSVLPRPLTVAMETAAAVAAINNGTNWPVLTQFVLEDNGDYGFVIAWLTDLPDDPDPNHYICHVISDHPEAGHTNYVFVDPNPDWVAQSAQDLIQAMAVPGCTQLLPVMDDPAWIWDYHLLYADPAAPSLTWREYRMSGFRLSYDG